jgi:UDP-N-acetyl-D-mannosaminuronic acid dehydrogenase
VAQVVRDGRLSATTRYEECRDAGVVIIAVETPVDEETRRPKYEALRAALVSLGNHLSRGTLVIVESTIAPLTMERVVRPILEETSDLRAGEDFYLAHCPERVRPEGCSTTWSTCPG